MCIIMSSKEKGITLHIPERIASIIDSHLLVFRAYNRVSCPCPGIKASFHIVDL